MFSRSKNRSSDLGFVKTQDTKALHTAFTMVKSSRKANSRGDQTPSKVSLNTSGIHCKISRGLERHRKTSKTAAKSSMEKEVTWSASEENPVAT